MGVIYDLSKETDFKNLTYKFKDENFSPMNFIGLKGPLHLYTKICNGDTNIEKAEECQRQFKLKISEIITRTPKYRTEDQVNAIKNITLKRKSHQIV